MKNLLKFAVTIAAVLVLIMSSAALQTYAATHTLQFVETPAVALYSSQSTSATTMVITPVPTDLQGNNLTMASFGSSPTVTVDPGILGAEEIESFTTLTNNGNNTVTLGGITRNLQSVYPYGTAGASLITHGAGATVVFSNNPQLYNRLAAWENDGVISGAWQFLATSKPTYASSPTFGSGDGLALVNYATLLATAFQGAATSTEGSMGIVQLATFAQVSAGTASSTSGAPLVIKASTASSTYNGATAFQGEIPVLRSTKNIDPNFIATSSSDTYNFGGTLSFNGPVTDTASTTFTNATTTFNGTTTIAASASNKLSLNGVPYVAPNTQGVANTFAKNDGLGNISWAATQVSTFTINNAVNIAFADSSTTIATIVLPANTLAANKNLKIDTISNEAVGGGCEIALNYGNGSATTTIGYMRQTLGNGFNAPGVMSTTIYGLTATTQAEYMPVPFWGSITFATTTYTGVNTANQSYLSYVTRTGANTCTLNGYSLTLQSN